MIDIIFNSALTAWIIVIGLTIAIFIEQKNIRDAVMFAVSEKNTIVNRINMLKDCLIHNVYVFGGIIVIGFVYQDIIFTLIPAFLLFIYARKLTQIINILSEEE